MSVEHWFQAAKATNGRDRHYVLSAQTPGDAKRRGRNIRLRHDWESVKVEVMSDLLRAKFREPDLRWKLLCTGTAELIEGNTWGDDFWGMSLYSRRGLNVLGILLMLVRDEFSAQNVA